MATRKAPARASSFIPFPIGAEGLLLVNHETSAADRQDLAALLLSTAGFCAEGIGHSDTDSITVLKQHGWSISFLIAIAQQVLISLDLGETV